VKLPITFVDLLNLVDDKIKYIYEYTPVFHLQNKYDRSGVLHTPNDDDDDDFPILFYWRNRQKIPATPFSVLPQAEDFNEEYANEMQLKQICLIAANGDVALSKRFYEDTDILEVYDFYILVSAYSINKN